MTKPKNFTSEKHKTIEKREEGNKDVEADMSSLSLHGMFN